MRRIAAAGLALALAGGAACGSHGAAPSWPTPAGWKAETLRFPLDFAPALPYQGVEQLRFAPGMFDKTATDYFSYAFAWELSLPGPADRDTIEHDLVTYFAGLAHAVGGANRPDIDGFQFHANLTGDLAGPAGIAGVVETFDAFARQAGVTLHVKVTRTACTGDRAALLFLASPHEPAAGDAVWAALDQLAAGYRC